MSVQKHHHDPADPLCLKIFEQLSEYVDGGLSPADCEAVQEHIRDCPPCVAFLESLKNSIQASRTFHADEPVKQLPDDVREKLKAAWTAALQRRTG